MGPGAATASHLGALGSGVSSAGAGLRCVLWTRQLPLCSYSGSRHPGPHGLAPPVHHGCPSTGQGLGTEKGTSQMEPHSPPAQDTLCSRSQMERTGLSVPSPGALGLWTQWRVVLGRGQWQVYEASSQPQRP